MSSENNKFPQKRIVITGAGSGLGRALALRFARDSWRVGIADIKLDGAEETLKLVRAAGGDGFVQHCDIALEADFATLAERVQKEWQRLDLLINNAGDASSGSVEATPLKDWEWMLNINLLGVVRGCRAFVPMLLKQRNGHIVNIASFAAIASAPGMAVGLSTKCVTPAASYCRTAPIISSLPPIGMRMATSKY